MKTFRCNTPIVDSVNGLIFKRGDFVETEELVWARRFGSQLQEVAPSEAANPKQVSNTRESKLSPKIVAKEPIKEEVKEVEQEDPIKEEVEKESETKAPQRKTISKKRTT